MSKGARAGANIFLPIGLVIRSSFAGEWENVLFNTMSERLPVGFLHRMFRQREPDDSYVPTVTY